jgi:hypothetical protein
MISIDAPPVATSAAIDPAGAPHLCFMTYTASDATMRQLRVGRRGALHRLRYSAIAVALVVCLAPTRGAQNPPLATVGLTGWGTFSQALPPGAATGAASRESPTQTDVKNWWPTADSFRDRHGQRPERQLAAACRPGVGAPIRRCRARRCRSRSARSHRGLAGDTVQRSLVVWTRQRAAGRRPVADRRKKAAPALRRFDTRLPHGPAWMCRSKTRSTCEAPPRSGIRAIVINDDVVFTQAAVDHYYLTRWRKTFAVVSAPFATVTPDMAAFARGAAMPPYSASLIANIVDTPAPADLGILESGGLDPIVARRSGRAPLPDWTMRYLAGRDLPRSLVLAAALSGSWPIHLRESEFGARRGLGAERFVSLDERRDSGSTNARRGRLGLRRGAPLPMPDAGPISGSYWPARAR